MAQPRFIEEIQARVSEIFASSPAKDIEKNMRAMLAGAFSRLNLVTREEFDVQAKVLARAREKLSEFEARVADLEKRVQEQGPK